MIEGGRVGNPTLVSYDHEQGETRRDEGTQATQAQATARSELGKIGSVHATSDAWNYDCGASLPNMFRNVGYHCWDALMAVLRCYITG